MISEEEFRAHLAMMDDFLRRSKEAEIEWRRTEIETTRDPGWRALLQEQLDELLADKNECTCKVHGRL
jgi:hypothetical protein